MVVVGAVEVVAADVGKHSEAAKIDPVFGLAADEATCAVEGLRVFEGSVTSYLGVSAAKARLVK